MMGSAEMESKFTLIAEVNDHVVNGAFYNSMFYHLTFLYYKSSNNYVVTIEKRIQDDYIPQIAVRYSKKRDEFNIYTYPTNIPLLDCKQYRRYQEVQSLVWKHLEGIQQLISKLKEVKQVC